MILAPSLLNAGMINLENMLKEIKEAGAEWLHIDVMDGHFVPNMSFGPGIISDLKTITDLILDCHLMVKNPEHLIPKFAKAGADIISVHIEATSQIFYAIQSIHDLGCKAGVVLNPGTSIDLLKPLLNHVDQILIMTINPGRPNQSFIETMLEKICELDYIRKQKGYKYKIQVDGNITSKTIRPCLDAGADIIVAGGAIFNDKNITANMKALKAAGILYDQGIENSNERSCL